MADAEDDGSTLQCRNTHHKLSLEKTFSDGEIEEHSVIRKFRITASGGKTYSTNHYNLSAIIVLLKSYEDYYYGCVDDKGREQKGYEERIAELLQKYPLGQPIVGEQNKKDFIVLFGNILRLRNILSAFDHFAGNEILSPIDFQDYTGTYHDVYEEMKLKPGSKDSIMDDVVFEMELVKQVEVNMDYILIRL